MQPVEVKWTFERIGFLSIIRVIGETHDNEISQKLLENAIDFIDIASHFDGKVLNNHALPNPVKSELTVSFSLIFPTPTKLNNFIQFVQSTSC